MNITDAIEQIKIEQIQHRDDLARCEKKLAFLDKLLPLTIPEDCSFNCWGSSVWISVTTRESLQTFFTLAPKWTKEGSLTHDGGLHYRAEIDGVTVDIRAYDKALPPTCRVVEEKMVIAAKPEQVITIKKVICET